MVRQDPARGVRGIFTNEMLKIIRLARQDAIQKLRIALEKRPIDVEEINFILFQNKRDIIEPRARAAIERYITMAYNQGVDNAIGRISAMPKPRPPKGMPAMKIALTFDREDMGAIKNLSEMYFGDLDGITTDMSREIVRKMVAADKQGAGLLKMAQSITETYSEIGLTRAERLCRTSMTQAYNEAAWTRIRQYAPFKEWIPTLTDNKTRESHRMMKGVIIPVEDPFKVPAFKASPRSKKSIPACEMQYPGDIRYDPDPGQFINCRCSLGPRFRKS
jgi:uncharacterized protein with gpF-like domain